MRLVFAKAAFAVVLSIVLFSCQKEVDEKLPDPPVPTISSDDPVELSGAIRVWHGKRKTGTLPASNSVLPTLNPTINLSITAIAGRYAIITPEVLDGDVKGYYLSVNGSGQYFDVDYSQPRDIAGRQAQRGIEGLGRFFSPQDGVNDSSIVIVLPPNMQVPDTFCVTYSAYDANGNIGQPITTCIYITSFGGGAGSEWLHNDWKIVAVAYFQNNQMESYDTIIHNAYTKTIGTAREYYCKTDPVTGSTELTNTMGMPGFAVIVTDSTAYRKFNIELSANGASTTSDIHDTKNVDSGNSNCTNFTFHQSTTSLVAFGGWNYNSATKKLLMLHEFNDNGTVETDIDEFLVKRDSDTRIRLIQEAGTEAVEIRLERN